MDTPLPLFAPIKRACDLLGITRTYLFDALARGDLRAVKAGRRTLVDVAHAAEHVRGLPNWTGRR